MYYHNERTKEALKPSNDLPAKSILAVSPGVLGKECEDNLLSRGAALGRAESVHFHGSNIPTGSMDISQTALATQMLLQQRQSLDQELALLNRAVLLGRTEKGRGNQLLRSMGGYHGRYPEGHNAVAGMFIGGGAPARSSSFDLFMAQQPSQLSGMLQPLNVDHVPMLNMMAGQGQASQVNHYNQFYQEQPERRPVETGGMINARLSSQKAVADGSLDGKLQFTSSCKTLQSKSDSPSEKESRR